jgi:hypothetical protein
MLATARIDTAHRRRSFPALPPVVERPTTAFHRIGRDRDVEMSGQDVLLEEPYPVWETAPLLTCGGVRPSTSGGQETPGDATEVLSSPRER